MIKSIHVKNMRGFKDKKIVLTGNDAIIGKNATGKSTMLTCLAIGVIGKHPLAEKKLSSIISMIPDGETEGTIILEQIAGDGKQTIIDRRFIKSNKKNTQKITINGKKYNVTKAGEKINTIFGDDKGRPFILRFNISKFIEMKDKDKQQFIFTVFGDKLSSMTCVMIRGDMRLDLLKAQEANFVSTMRLIYNVSDFNNVPEGKKEECLDKVEAMFDYTPDEKEAYSEIIGLINEVPDDVIIQEFIEDIIIRVNELKCLRQEELDATRKGLSENRLFLENLRPVGDIEKEIEEINEKKKSLEKQKVDYANYTTNQKEYEKNIKTFSTLEPVNAVELKRLKGIQKNQKSIVEQVKTIKEEIKTLKIQRDDHKGNKEEHAEKIKIQGRVGLNKKNAITLKVEEGVLEKEIAKLTTEDNKRIAKNKEVTKVEEDLKGSNDILENDIKEVKNKLKLLKEGVAAFKLGVCPTCGTSVKSKDMKYDLEKSIKDIETYTTKISEEEELLTINRGQEGALLVGDVDPALVIKKTELKAVVEKINSAEIDIDSEIDEAAGKKAYPNAEKLYNDVVKKITGKEDGILADLQVKIADEQKLSEDIKAIEGAQSRNKVKNDELKKLVVPKVINLPNEVDELIQDAANRLVPLEEEKTKTLENQGVEKVVVQQEDKVEKLEKVSQFVRAMEKVLRSYKNTVVGKMLGTIPAKADAIVKKVMPDVSVVFDGEKCGIYRGQYIPLKELSGGEGVIVTGAIIAAMMQEARVKEKIVSFEANELDNENIILLMKALEGTDLDNVLLSTYPRGGALKDKAITKTWGIINL